jgi:REP element-mobilizing transposase RayT
VIVAGGEKGRHFPRLVLSGIAYHVTQRGNRRAQTFFEDGGYALYCDLLAQSAEKAGAEVWCYCLMPNHVHVIIMPPLLAWARMAGNVLPNGKMAVTWRSALSTGWRP